MRAQVDPDHLRAGRIERHVAPGPDARVEHAAAHALKHRPPNSPVAAVLEGQVEQVVEVRNVRRIQMLGHLSRIRRFATSARVAGTLGMGRSWGRRPRTSKRCRAACEHYATGTVSVPFLIGAPAGESLPRIGGFSEAWPWTQLPPGIRGQSIKRPTAPIEPLDPPLSASVYPTAPLLANQLEDRVVPECV